MRRLGRNSPVTCNSLYNNQLQLFGSGWHGICIIAGEHEREPLLVADAKEQRPTGRLSIHPIRGGNNEPLLSTSALACLDNGSRSCRAGKATVNAEETCSHAPAQIRGYTIYGPAIEALQAFAVGGYRPSRAMTTPLPAYPSGDPFATLLASPFGSMEPVAYYYQGV